MNEDNFKLALLSIKELKVAQEQTQQALEETQQAVVEGFRKVAVAQADMGQRINALIDVLEKIGENSLETHQRLDRLEQRVDKLEEAS